MPRKRPKPPPEHGNVAFVCAKHAPKPLAKFARMGKKRFIGKDVKLGFPINPRRPRGRKEHMWVRVTGLATVRGQELHGILNDDPRYVRGWFFGAELEFNRNEIEEIYDGR